MDISEAFVVDEKTLKKQVMSILSDSTPIEEPKNPDSCNVFALYKLLGAPEQVASLQAKYEAGNFGYGHAKQALFELIVEKLFKRLSVLLLNFITFSIIKVMHVKCYYTIM